MAVDNLKLIQSAYKNITEEDTRTVPTDYGDFEIKFPKSEILYELRTMHIDIGVLSRDDNKLSAAMEKEAEFSPKLVAACLGLENVPEELKVMLLKMGGIASDLVIECMDITGLNRKQDNEEDNTGQPMMDPTN